VFEDYHQELLQSDRDEKTIKRYGQVISTYRKWLADRLPDVVTAKEYLADLRQKGYKPNSVLLHYHALQVFFDFIGQPFKLKMKASGAAEILRSGGF